MKLFCLSGVFVLFAVLAAPRFGRLHYVVTLFDEGRIVSNFRDAHKSGGFPIRTAHRGDRVADFIDSTASFKLPETFTFDGEDVDLEAFLRDHWTTGLVVLRIEAEAKAHLLHESYYLGNAAESHAISWSVGKSFVGALVGTAVADGVIESLEDPVERYAPALVGSGYEGVRIKDVLQMSSGIRFDEDYFSFFSDINKMGRALALGSPISAFVASLQNERAPGTYNHYVSMDTQVLGMVVTGATNKTLTSYLEEKLWSRAGFEADVHWFLDNDVDQMELAFGTLNARTRDYARFGWLYLNGGRSPLDGTQLVPEEWVRQSVTPDAPHLMPGKNNVSDLPFGYGYQWWIPGADDAPEVPGGDFVAIGVYNQFIYVAPKERVVIARNSAFAGYKADDVLSERQAIACFRAIAAAAAAAAA